MSQVLSIRFSTNPLQQAEVFLGEWAHIGTWLPITDGSYELHSHSGDNLLLTVAETELEITGYTHDETVSFIQEFSKRFGGELLHDGEPLQDEQNVSRWKALGPFTKAAAIVGIILLLPLIIIALPVLLLVFFSRLAFHFIRLSRGGSAKP